MARRRRVPHKATARAGIRHELHVVHRELVGRHVKRGHRTKGQNRGVIAAIRRSMKA